jgi:hypothetical protein
MTRLTRAKQLTKSASVFIGIGLVVLIIGRVLFGIINQVFIEGPRQAKANLPTVAFGELSPPVLQPLTVSTSSTNLRLDLVSSQFPQASAAAKVYKVANPPLSLTAQDRARATATNLGFEKVTPTQPTPSEFLWTDGMRALSINLASQNYVLTTDLAKVNFAERQAFSQFTPIADQTSNLLRQLSKLTDINYASPVVQFVTPVGDNFVPQPDDAAELTKYARVSFYRQDLDNLPVFSAHGKVGPITMVAIPQKKATNTFSPKEFGLDQIVWMANRYYPLDPSEPATYPITDAATAYAALEQNFGQYLVSLDPIAGQKVPSAILNARTLYARLCYIEPNELNTGYLQPVWMFEGRATTDSGEARWIAYIPAIDQAKTAKLIADQK